ncbi:MAG: hypothetical protein IJX28_00140 [Clostridia bacterium]|nr:hypothetical protein [Clostridia bacterium]
MSQVFFNLLVHLFYFIGTVFLIGFAIHHLNRLFYRLLDYRMGICYATGVIGTPIHELSHAVACLLFRHKIQEMRLFQIDRESGVLGYVSHSYNPKSLYQRVGNYFIGVAPILVGTLFLCWMMKLLLPEAFSEFTEYLGDFSYLQGKGVSWKWLAYAWAVFWGSIEILFSSISAGLHWWIFMILALCVSIHMNLSGADIKGALSALPLLAVLLAVAHAVLFFLPGDLYAGFVQGVNVAGSYLTGILLLSLLLSVFSVGLAAVGAGISRLLGRRR